MVKSLSPWKKMLRDYYLLCFVQYCVIVIVGSKFLSDIYTLYFYKYNIKMTLTTTQTIFFIAPMIMGVFIKGKMAKLQTISVLLVTIGAVLSVLNLLYILKFNSSVLTFRVVVLFFVATIIMCMWTIFFFFTFDKETITVLMMRWKKKNVTYYVLAVCIFTFVTFTLLYRYFKSQLSALLSMGFANRADGLNATQVMGLVDTKVLQVDLLQTVLLVVISVVFFWPYKKLILGPDDETVSGIK